MDIVGARFHCAICDSVDICSNCESVGLPGNLDSSDGGHVSSHIMIKVITSLTTNKLFGADTDCVLQIPFPVPIAELQSASETAKLIIAGRDATTVAESRPRSRRNSFMSSRTVLGSGTHAGDQNGSSTASRGHEHGIPCNECDQVSDSSNVRPEISDLWCFADDRGRSISVWSVPLHSEAV